MSKRVAAPIKTDGDLRELQKKNPNAIVVGVTSSGAIYKLESGNAVRLDPDQVAAYLNLAIEDVQALSSNPKSFRFPLKEAAKEAPENPKEAAEEGQIDEEIVEEAENTVDVKALQTRVVELEQAVEEIRAVLDKTPKRKK